MLASEVPLSQLFLLLLVSGGVLTRFCESPREWVVQARPVAIHEPLSNEIIDYVNRVSLQYHLLYFYFCAVINSQMSLLLSIPVLLIGIVLREVRMHCLAFDLSKATLK